MSTSPVKDLIVLVADGNIAASFKGIATRTDSLAIRDVQFDVYVSQNHDPGCLLRSNDFLQSFARQYKYALVIFDKDGCGRKQVTREALEIEVEDRLASTGWQARGKAVVIDPELEAWVWSDFPHVADILGWQAGLPSLRNRLIETGFLTGSQIKPEKPKEAVEAILRQVRKPRSSSIYKQLAETVGLHRCSDPAFLKLKSTLQGWFAR